LNHFKGLGIIFFQKVKQFDSMSFQEDGAFDAISGVKGAEHTVSRHHWYWNGI
jgi:hypothetical protein